MACRALFHQNFPWAEQVVLHHWCAQGLVHSSAFLAQRGAKFNTCPDSGVCEVPFSVPPAAPRNRSTLFPSLQNRMEELCSPVSWGLLSCFIFRANSLQVYYTCGAGLSWNHQVV